MGYDLQDLLRERAEWKRAGRRVVLTNGCFDLLHPGHVALLERARAEGDLLVVAINSDASVRALKGPARPLLPENERAEALRALEAVDRVVVYDEPTPLELIERVRPDVLVKGADYSLEQVVGADLVKSYGGQVMLAHLEEGHSTTGTIERAGKSS